MGRTESMSQGQRRIEHMFDEEGSGESRAASALGVTAIDVALQAALSYQLHGHEAEVSDLEDASEGSLVIVPALSRLDVAADASTNWEPLLSAIEKHAAAGWEVWAVVPLNRLAEAHRTCRGKATFVQGWWVSEGGLTFTRPEIP